MVLVTKGLKKGCVRKVVFLMWRPYRGARVVVVDPGLWPLNGRNPGLASFSPTGERERFVLQ